MASTLVMAEVVQDSDSVLEPARGMKVAVIGVTGPALMARGAIRHSLEKPHCMGSVFT
jgi:hypothetical protein